MARFRSRLFAILLTFLFFAGLAMPVGAQSGIQVISDLPSLNFPDSLLFQAEFQAESNITSVVLEYGSNQLTCGTVEAMAFPTVTPGKDVKVSWTWDMRQSGSLPPGATVWWRWQVSAVGGTQFTSPTKTVLWLDSTHSWQDITGGNIDLHYYSGGSSFAEQLHTAAVQALQRLSRDVGVTTTSPVDIYIYASTTDLQESILYEPSWTGGEAFSEYNIVIIGIPPDQLDWGMSTEAHELTHVLVGHLTFSCLGFVPTWLNEGLAVYGEGGPQPDEQAQFDNAKSTDQLPSLRSLTGGFSEESSRATISYAEAYSVVNYLIKTFGQDKMIALLEDLRDGQAIDAALQAVYGFDLDGLDASWRVSIGAAQPAGISTATPIAAPTEVPTFVPVGAAPIAAAAPTSHPTLEKSPAAPVATPTGSVSYSSPQPGLGLSRITTVIIIALACLVILAVLAGLVVFWIVRSQNRRVK